MEEGSGKQEHQDASEKRDEERTERVHKQVVFLTEGTRGGAKDASVTIKKQLIPLGQSVPGVRVSLAMTHSRGRSCHGEVKGRRRVKNGAEAGRPCGPRGTNKARVTKGRGLRSACTNLSGNSVLQSPPVLCGASHFLPAQECAFCTPACTHEECRPLPWLVIIVMADAEEPLRNLLGLLVCKHW